MYNSKRYFTLARNEETAGNEGAALLLYLSSFCESFNCSEGLPCGTVSKIRSLQLSFGLSDEQLCVMVRSYGFLSDEDCRDLLLLSILGDAEGIHRLLSDKQLSRRDL